MHRRGDRFRSSLCSSVVSVPPCCCYVLCGCRCSVYGMAKRLRLRYDTAVTDKARLLQRLLAFLLLAALLGGCYTPASATALVPLSTLNPPAFAATATANAAAATTPATPQSVTLAAVATDATSKSAAGPTADAYSAHVATEWFKLFVRLTPRAPGFSPPVAARAYAYAGVTLYEALVTGMPGYHSLSGQLTDMPAMPAPPTDATLIWPAVANAALASIARDLFPTINDTPLRLTNQLESKLEDEIAEAFGAELSPGALEASLAYGRSIADAVFAWSRSDGGDEGYAHNVSATYVQPVGEGLWTPTPPDYAPPLQPAWGNNRPMAPVGVETCAAPPPPEYSTEPTSQFYKEAREVYDSVRGLTEAQEEIAYYWSDDAGSTATPPGHSVSIATQVLGQEESTLAQAALLYARLGIALNDAFITCWQTKYTWNVMRPLTYIQNQIDPNWNEPDPTDPVRTPPFPEYTSGHSVASRAAAEILTDAFGDSYRFTDITHVDRGIAPRTFPSFYAAAAEAAISRLYGGIHYRSAIEQGLAQGACVGQRVLELQFEQP